MFAQHGNYVSDEYQAQGLIVFLLVCALHCVLTYRKPILSTLVEEPLIFLGYTLLVGVIGIVCWLGASPGLVEETVRSLFFNN